MQCTLLECPPSCFSICGVPRAIICTFAKRNVSQSFQVMNVPGQMPRSSKSILVISCCPLLCCFDAVQMIDACLTGHVFDSFNWMVQKNLKEHNLRILPVVWRWRLRPRWSANRRQPPGVQRLRERDTPTVRLRSTHGCCPVMLCHAINCCVLSQLTCHFPWQLSQFSRSTCRASTEPSMSTGHLGTLDDFPCDLCWLWSAELQMTTGGKMTRWKRMHVAFK